MALVVLISNACKSSYGRFTYIFNQTAHCTDKTSHRVLCCSGNNIKMLHAPDGSVTSLQSGIYLEKQFHQSLKKAFNPKRQYQCQSIIFSFSNSEFDTSDIKNQSAQALQIVQGYVHKFFGEAQSVSAAQVDGVGGKLHVHLIINTVKTTAEGNACSVKFNYDAETGELKVDVYKADGSLLTSTDNTINLKEIITNIMNNKG